MKIAIVVPIEESVPPKFYGGTELVAYNLIEQLVTMGHDVTLIGSGDSKTSAKLIAPIPKALRADPDTPFAKYRDRYKYLYTGEVINILRDLSVDIIHNHLGWRLLPFTPLLNTPVITTMHGPLNVADQQIVFEPFPHANYVSISFNQRKGMPHLNFVANVYNGIDVHKFKVGRGPRDYVAFLGRMSPEKGPVLAIQAAQKAGVPIKMAAKVDAVDAEYFETQVKPLIDGDKVQFLGEINHEQKVKFLGGAKALLVPTQWEEPFGLVNAEAFACGTPVIALPMGSLPELVDEGRVGFICKDANEMAERIADVHKLRAADCRAHAEARFSSERMAKDYIAAYKKVLDSKTQNDA